MYLHPVGIQIVSNFTVCTVNVAVVKIDRYLISCQFLCELCRYYTLVLGTNYLFVQWITSILFLSGKCVNIVCRVCPIPMLYLLCLQ